MFHQTFIRSSQFGLRFVRDEFAALLPPGEHTEFDPFGRVRVDVVDANAPQLTHPRLREIVASGVLDGLAVVVDLSQHRRAVVRVDERLHAVLRPGLSAFFTTRRRVAVEEIDATPVRLQRGDLAVLRGVPGGDAIAFHSVPADHAGLLRLDRQTQAVLPAGEYGFWKDERAVELPMVDLREQAADVQGQEILTADNVTLRVNAVAVFRVDDPRAAAEAAADVHEVVYRQAQLALRSVVGARTLEELLADKVSAGREATEAVASAMSAAGVRVASVGIKDLILPGEMKALMNRVTEARKAAEADQIRRKEETQAVRSQANTARVLENNPTLMRLRELEVLETIARESKLEVLLGGDGLRSQVTKML